MATFTSKDIIKTMLENDGTYPGDPQCETIYQYTTPLGATAWAVYYNEWCDIFDSSFYQNPILLFDKFNGINEDGLKFLEEYS